MHTLFMDYIFGAIIPEIDFILLLRKLSSFPIVWKKGEKIIINKKINALKIMILKQICFT